MPKALVTGAGGFIGGHLVGELLQRGYSVRGVDVKPHEEWFQSSSGAESLVRDLADVAACREVSQGIDHVFHLAADMGGMGFIESNKAACMLSVLPTTHLLLAARDAGVQRFFYSSSACVYPAGRQTTSDVTPLEEESAYPAMPEDGYGWEKLFAERMCRHFREDFGLETRVARYHNVFGPCGSWRGGREKAPAAISRKVATAVQTGDHTINIWGDGEQTRSFTFIDDCVRGTIDIALGAHPEPVNLGSSELVSINDVVSILEDHAGVTLGRTYDLDAPKGVRGRNSDNAEFRRRYGWEPDTPLKDGLATTYDWIFEQMKAPAEVQASPC